MTASSVRILVCFAVPHEARLFRQKIGQRPDVAVRLTGIGRANAERSIRAFLQQIQPHLVISSGLAGGLASEIPCAQVVFDADDGFPLERSLIAAGARRVHFHCAPQIVVTAEAKADLWKTTKCEAVEMESQAIRQICRECNVSSATVRVISDAAADTLPIDFNRCLTPDFRFAYRKLLGLLWRSPSSIPELIRFQQGVTRANRALADVLCRIIAT